MTIELLIALTTFSSKELRAHVVMTTTNELLDESISELDSSWYHFQGSVKSFIDYHNSVSLISKIGLKNNIVVLQGS